MAETSNTSGGSGLLKREVPPLASDLWLYDDLAGCNQPQTNKKALILRVDIDVK